MPEKVLPGPLNGCQPPVKEAVCIPVSYTHLTGGGMVSYPKVRIRLQFSNRFQDHRSASAQHKLPGHYLSLIHIYTAASNLGKAHMFHLCSD